MADELPPLVDGLDARVFGLTSGFFYLPATQADAWGVAEESWVEELCLTLAVGHAHFAIQDAQFDAGSCPPELVLLSDVCLLEYLNLLDRFGPDYRTRHDTYYLWYVRALSAELSHRSELRSYSAREVSELGLKAAPGNTVLHLVADDLEERQGIRTLRRDLMRQMFDEESRSERRKTAAKPTEGQPQAGLTPWREIITPHADVASGRFDQAEFAADLFEVYSKTADEEYQDPKAFFLRPYVPDARASGPAGRSCKALVGRRRRPGHRAPDELRWRQDAQHDRALPPGLRRRGQGLAWRWRGSLRVGRNPPAEDQPSGSRRPDDLAVGAPSSEKGIELRTLWGHLAYQLGGKAGYELVRTDDEAGTNPGAALRTLFQQFGPAVVLIDEWVAYARQLRDGGDGDRLAGGDFDTQFTFAQALTEAAAAVPNVVVLVSIPASDIEVGGDRGKTALEKLKNVVTRKAAQWQPASPDESFEIVRRRLFDPFQTTRRRSATESSERSARCTASSTGTSRPACPRLSTAAEWSSRTRFILSCSTGSSVTGPHSTSSSGPAACCA
ncbi:MAG: DUF499 domain-containing protein [Actinobacteria bacterium ATB1]|nr:DUF499 domain-containing protein [Actinobacteria bacterium ATB1]